MEIASVSDFSFREAAEACGVARITIRRHFEKGAFPHAWRADGARGPGTGPWRIPLEDLRTAGFSTEARATAPVRRTGPRRTRASADSTSLLLVEQRRREIAEAIAAERADHIADLRLALESMRGLCVFKHQADDSPRITAETSA